MSRATSLLLKANTQLRGERVPIKNKEEDELTKYLSGLSQKTGQQTKSVNFEDLGENISISSDSNLQKTPRKRNKSPAFGSAATRFLKKKTPDPENVDEVPSVTPSPRGPRRSYRPATAVPVVSSAKSTKAESSVPRKSSALDKAKALTHKINDRGATVNKRSFLETDTDDSVSLAHYMQHGSADQLKSASEKSIGRDGNRFLKKKAEDEQTSETIATRKIEGQRPTTPSRGQRRPDRDAPKPGSGSAVPEYANKGQKKYSPSVHLTSEEESMADFIHRLSSADEARSRKKARENKEKFKARDAPSPDLSLKRTPSPPTRTPRHTPSPIAGRKYSRSPSQDSDNVDSIRSEVADTQESDSHGNIFHSNLLMDLDTLEPMALSPEPAEKKTKTSKKSKGKEKKSKTKSKSKEAAKSIFKASGKEDVFKAKPSSKSKDTKASGSFFSNAGLHTVDELLGATDNKEESVASEVSEIVTEKSDIFTAKKRRDSVSSIASEVIQDASQQVYTESFDDESISERIGQGSVQAAKQVRWSVVSEVRTEYSDETTQGDYDEDFESESKGRSYTRTYESETDGYTSDTETLTRSYTADSHHSPPHKPSRPETNNVEIQTDSGPGLGYNWNIMNTGLAISGPGYGLGFVDPTPIASHVVSADALEAMTSYSPCMLALQDLLRQQLVLTQNFLATQRRIYEASTATLEESFKYTTLEDTKQYIRKHQKPRLTFKKALKMVTREMDR